MKLHNPPPDMTVEESEANIFCFGVFADKPTEVVYNDLTGKFPFMSLDGNQCFFVMYHYESNVILVKPLLIWMTSQFLWRIRTCSITSKARASRLKSTSWGQSGYQTSKHFLTKNDCLLQLVESHNHRLNAAERAIQTFKDHFISGLRTTDVDFPVQLWNQLPP